MWRSERGGVFLDQPQRVQKPRLHRVISNAARYPVAAAGLRHSFAPLN